MDYGQRRLLAIAFVVMYRHGGKIAQIISIRKSKAGGENENRRCARGFSQMKPAYKKICLILARIGILSVVTFMLGEVVLRVYDHFNPSFVFFNDSYNRFRGKPFADDWNFKLNSLGFKDKEFSEKKAKGYRIVALGDSFAFGVVPYQDNYLTLVESQLQKEHPEVDVLNMGIVGIGPKDYLSLFIREGLAFKPDLVLLSFFVGNDFSGARKHSFSDYSYVASLIHRVATVWHNYEGNIIHGKGEYCDDCPTMSADRFLKIEHSRSSIYVKGNGRFPRSLENALFYLERVKNICKERGIDYVVAIIPDELQVDPELQREIRKKFHPNVDDGQWETTLPNRILARRLSESGIDNLDLYDEFAVVGARQRLYKLQDTHWNIAGNRLAAAAIAKHLQKYVK